jgi:hypothetical protein
LMDALETALQASSISDVSSQFSAAGALSEHQDAHTPLPLIPAAVSAQANAALSPSTGSLVTTNFHWKSWLLGISVAAMCLVFSVVAAIAATNLKGIFIAQKPTQTRQFSAIPRVSPSAGPTLTRHPTAKMTPIILPSESSTPTSPPVNSPSKIYPTLVSTIPSNQPGGEVTLPPTISQPIPTSIPHTPTATLKYTDRRKFIIYYNETSFYMLQRSGVGDLIGGVAFERLDPKGQPLNRFNGSRWAIYSPSSMLDWCFRLEISGAGGYLRPPECEGKYMATLHPEPGDPTIFWKSDGGSTLFRVLWQDEELVRCEIAAGICEVYLP